MTTLCHACAYAVVSLEQLPSEGAEGEAAEALRTDILAVMGKLADQEVKEMLITDARRVLAGEGKPRPALQDAQEGDNAVGTKAWVYNWVPILVLLPSGAN